MTSAQQHAQHPCKAESTIVRTYPVILCTKSPTSSSISSGDSASHSQNPAPDAILGFGDIIAFEYQQTPPLHFCRSLSLYFPFPNCFRRHHPARRITLRRCPSSTICSAPANNTRSNRSSCDIPPSTRTSFFFPSFWPSHVYIRNRASLRRHTASRRLPPSAIDTHTLSTPTRPPATALSTLMKSCDHLRGRPPGI